MRNGQLQVLLVGMSVAAASELRQWLERRGCHCRMAASYREACGLLRRASFDLVLSQMHLPDGSAYPLLAALQGVSTTLFFCLAVHHGCWWLPAIDRGQMCWGAPALRPREFARALDTVVGEMSLVAQAG